MDFKNDKQLLHKLASGTASSTEKKLFEEWLFALDTETYVQFLDEYQKISLATELALDPHAEDLWDKIEIKIDKYEYENKRIKSNNWKYRISIAASILLVFAISLYFLLGISKLEVSEKLVGTKAPKEIMPGGNKAILKLGDGSRVILEDSSEGTIFLQAGMLAKKTKDGQLIYEKNDVQLNSSAISYNTIETPNGGQYQVVLPDGTKVWLNASSSLTFPTTFNGKERKVELLGEAYFEVTKNKDMPFIVNTGKEIIHVLGTHFNVNSYPDEEFSKTTLVEGKVRISLAQDQMEGDYSRILQPGEQSIITASNIKVVTTDVQESLAWKNGEFMFNNEGIESVMRKIARWYDVEIIYPKKINDSWIWGSVSRFEDISEVLKVIELTGSVHFKVEGRRVYVVK